VSRRKDATEANFLLTEYMSQFKRDLGQKGDEAALALVSELADTTSSA